MEALEGHFCRLAAIAEIAADESAVDLQFRKYVLSGANDPHQATK